jgi:hypothetical protein
MSKKAQTPTPHHDRSSNLIKPIALRPKRNSAHTGDILSNRLSEYEQQATNRSSIVFANRTNRNSRFIDRRSSLTQGECDIFSANNNESANKEQLASTVNEMTNYFNKKFEDVDIRPNNNSSLQRPHLNLIKMKIQNLIENSNSNNNNSNEQIISKDYLNLDYAKNKDNRSTTPHSAQNNHKYFNTGFSKSNSRYRQKVKNEINEFKIDESIKNFVRRASILTYSFTPSSASSSSSSSSSLSHASQASSVEDNMLDLDQIENDSS